MNRTLVTVALLIGHVSVLASESGHWTAPIGIPVPEFGIEESHLMYAGETNYHNAGHGPYSIYVDNSASNCSNRGAGTAKKPRCDIPQNIADPGTVIEIHGGPYDYEMEKPVLDINGSAAKPVFLRGVDDGNGYPVIENASVIAFQGQYFIVENLIFLHSSVRTASSATPRYGRHHMSFRNLEIAHHPSKNGSGLGGSDIVFYKNHVHHNQGDDRHGTSVGNGSERVWILDNYFHHNGGDAVQFCHRCKENPPRNVYVGRNRMHSDRENGVDLKYGKDIVVSENTIYGYRASRPDTEWCYDDDSYCGVFSSGSDGAAIVIGSDGAPGRPWIIANNIFDSVQGIRIEEVREAWIIGNKIHNISRNGIALDKWGESVHIIGNTIYEADYGLNQHWRDKFSVFVSNNVFSNIAEEALSAKPIVAERSIIENNLFWNGTEKVQFRWGKPRYKETPSAAVVEFKIGGAVNFVADPGISKVAADQIKLADDNPAFKSLRQHLEIHEKKFKSIYGESASILAPSR